MTRVWITLMSPPTRRTVYLFLLFTTTLNFIATSFTAVLPVQYLCLHAISNPPHAKSPPAFVHFADPALLLGHQLPQTVRSSLSTDKQCRRAVQITRKYSPIKAREGRTDEAARLSQPLLLRPPPLIPACRARACFLTNRLRFG